jgi:hypothetical protein
LTELLKPQTAEQGWSRAEAPTMIKFEKPGQEICGKLFAVILVEVGDKKVVQYVIDFDGKRFTFLGTYDLVQKIGRQHVGCELRIKYLGDDEKIQRRGNSLKVFDVLFRGDPKKVPQGGSFTDGSPITDEDIPF